MPTIVIELFDGSHQPVRLQTPPDKTAARVLDACSRKFGAVGCLSPKDDPDLLLEGNDILAGGRTYVFTPGGSQGMQHRGCHLSQAAAHMPEKPNVTVFSSDSEMGLFHNEDQLSLQFALCLPTFAEHLYASASSGA